MRFAVAALLALHGLIHLLGFLKPWKFATVSQLSGRTLVPLSEPAARLVGVVWLGTALLLVAAAGLRWLDREPWWIPAAVGLVLSQALIVLQWSDAKAGTVANVLLLVPVVVGFATSRFHAESEVHVRALLARAPAEAAPILGPSDVAPLPPPVRRWLEASGAIGRPRARTVRLAQRGEMRTSADAAFMHTEAIQYFTVDTPGFVWMADVAMHGVPVVARDSYVEGHGRMFIRAAGLVTVADGTGEKFDQGTLLRFLGEIIWFPSAAVAPYISWEPIDDGSALARISDHGVTASAVFAFDAQGRLTSLAAKRYFNGETLEDWVIPITEWKTIRGIAMPTRGSAVWKLAKGDLEYYRWEILDVETNPSASVGKAREQDPTDWAPRAGSGKASSQVGRRRELLEPRIERLEELVAETGPFLVVPPSSTRISASASS